jgi:hypothetical protein
MMRRLTTWALALAFGAPALCQAQTFGTRREVGQTHPVRGADPVDVEIVQEGRPIWQGRLNSGIGLSAAMELFAQSPDLMNCPVRSPGSGVGIDDLDVLALTIRWTDTSPTRDRYAIALERRRVRAVPSVPGRYFSECREHGHHGETLRFNAEVRLPPGERVRVDGAGGFEIFLTRPADATTPEPRPGGGGGPTPHRTDFDIVIERAGEHLWEGTLHQESDSDRTMVEGLEGAPPPAECRRRNPAPRCSRWSSEDWKLILRVRDDRSVDVEFYARRGITGHKRWMDGALWDRPHTLRVEARPELALAPGHSALMRVQDYVIRIGRR